MTKSRMEAFSDGVMAIIITIMAFELKLPPTPDMGALVDAAPAFLYYLLSFVFLGIYWSNHHHLLQAVHHVDGRILWANLHLLFWLSLIPATTAWMGHNHVAPLPVALYGVVLICSAIAYTILIRVLIARHGSDSPLAVAVGSDAKGKISLACYAVALPLAFVNVWFSIALYALVSVIWLVPDKRMEQIVG